MSVRAALSLALAFALAAPSAARAADPAAQARELFQKGVQALAANRTQEAIDSFEAGYKSSRAPSMLFYLGEAYRQAGNRAKALDEYQAYVEKMPAGPKRAEADARIAELKKGSAPAPPPAPAAPKRKLSLDEMDLKGDAPKEPAAEAAKEPAKAPKKMLLDDLELGAKSAAPAPAATAAAEAPRERRRRSRKSEETAAAAPASAPPASAPPAPSASAASGPAPQPVAAVPTPAAAPPPATAPLAAAQPAPKPVAVANEPEPSKAAPSAAASELPRPSPLAQTIAPEVIPSQPTRPAEPIREAPPLTPEDIELARRMAATLPGAKVATAEGATPLPPPPAKAPPPADDFSAPLPRPSSRRAPSGDVATTAGSSSQARAASEPLEVALISGRAPRGSDGSAQRDVALVVGTVGVAALAAGGLFGLGAKNAANDLDATAQGGGQYDPAVQTRGQRDQRFEIIFLAAGGAALATGVLVYALAPSSGAQASSEDAAPRKPETTPRLAAATLTPVPGGMAATAKLSF